MGLGRGPGLGLGDGAAACLPHFRMCALYLHGHVHSLALSFNMQCGVWSCCRAVGRPGLAPQLPLCWCLLIALHLCKSCLFLTAPASMCSHLCVLTGTRDVPSQEPLGGCAAGPAPTWRWAEGLNASCFYATAGGQRTAVPGLSPRLGSCLRAQASEVWEGHGAGLRAKWCCGRRDSVRAGTEGSAPALSACLLP